MKMTLLMLVFKAFIIIPMTAQAGLMTTIECRDGGQYMVEMSENLTTNDDYPLSIVQVFDLEAGPYEVIYRGWYNFEYRAEPIFPGGPAVEMWFYHQAGNVSVDDLPAMDYMGNLIAIGIGNDDGDQASGEISIDMGEHGLLDMFAYDCTLR